METIKGTYSLDGIKYFNPYVGSASLTCPHCGGIYTVDFGDGFIEYPEKHMVLSLDCYLCDESFSLKLEIELSVKIKYHEQITNG